jgi:hypothetical protein
VNGRALTGADVKTLVAAIVPAIVEAFEVDPPKPQVNSAMRIGIEVGILLGREPLLSANEVNARVRGRREVVHEAVRLAKAELLGARRSGSKPRRSRVVESDAEAGSQRFPRADPGLQGAHDDPLLVEEGPASGKFGENDDLTNPPIVDPRVIEVEPKLRRPK